jgi:hypothetical protein
MAKNAAIYNGAQPIAEVALVYSNRTRNLTFGSSLETLLQTQHLLDDAGIPYIVITEPNIARIQDFPYVIFPEVTFATDAVHAEVAKYQGKLLLVGDSLIRDGWDENDLPPSVKAMSVQEAINSVPTTPIQVEGAEGLFVELFKKGEAFQVRLFDPNLTEDFEALAKTVTLTFNWPGDVKVSGLEFLGETVTLETTREGDTVSVDVPFQLFTTVTIK